MKRRDSKAGFINIFLVSAIIILFFSSCATHRDTLDIKKNLADMNTSAESRFSSIEQKLAFLDSLIQEQHRVSMGLRAMMGTQTQEQMDNNTSVAARLEENNSLLRELLNKLQAIQLYGGAEIQKPAQPNAPADTTRQFSLPQNIKSSVNPEELYKSTMDDINDRNYPLAESRLMAFVVQFPNHELAGNAQYWLGETSFAQQKYEQAIKEFDKVLENYPKSPKVPAAMLKKGFSLIEIDQTQKAQAILQSLTKKYPKSDEAKFAREKLKSL